MRSSSLYRCSSVSLACDDASARCSCSAMYALRRAAATRARSAPSRRNSTAAWFNTRGTSDGSVPVKLTSTALVLCRTRYPSPALTQAAASCGGTIRKLTVPGPSPGGCTRVRKPGPTAGCW